MICVISYWTDRVRQHMQALLIIALMATRTGLRSSMVTIGVAIEGILNTSNSR